MYELVEKATIFADQLEGVVARRSVNDALLRRLDRLRS